MRGTRWTFGLAAVLAGTLGLTRAADDQGYDLRGPAPKVGQTTITKTTFKIKDANVVIKLMGQNVAASQTLTATQIEETKALAVDGRQTTKAQTKVTKEQYEAKTSILGMDVDEKKAGDLDGETILAERGSDGKWKSTLIDTKPTAKQRRSLERRIGPESEDVLYPAGKLKPGHTWKVEAKELQRIFGATVTDLKGTIEMKFVKTEDVGGELCAVVESNGKMTGVAHEEEGDLEVELDLKGTTWRSIKSAINVKDKATGKLRMSGKITTMGLQVDVTIDGPFTIDSTTERK